MQFEEFQENVIQWSKDRLIIPNGTVDSQMGKFIEECGELYQAVVARDENEIKDGIGDVAVTIINASRLAGDTWNYSAENGPLVFKRGDPLDTIKDVMERAFSMDFRTAIEELHMAAIELHCDFEFCCQLAWHVIKDRKGHTDENGLFHKEIIGSDE